MRTKELFCDGWLFHRGEIIQSRLKTKGPMYGQAKTERFRSGPASIYYNDRVDPYLPTDKGYPTEDWEHIRLPHDYVIEGIPDPNENCAHGYLKYDNAWYRKHFTLSEEDKGKRILIEFEGVSGESCVYLNGCLIKRNFCGYTSFIADISDYAVYGGENVIAVHIDLSKNEGWWYEGGGIYRSVWIEKTEKIAIDTYGVYVNPIKIDKNNWALKIETTLINATTQEQRLPVITEIIDKRGNVVSTAKAIVFVAPHDKATVKYESTLRDPVLWDIDNPYMYAVKTTIYKGDAPIDVFETRTGFRYFKCDPKNGFFLNGRKVVIKGVCVHEDSGLLGKAIPENVNRYKIELMKEMGANGYRTAHYQQSSAILDALDELGFIVLDEARWFGSTDEVKAQLEELVKRDRNRPSVFFWSLSNEEDYHATDVGRCITETLIHTVRKLDKSRPITSAISVRPLESTVLDELDIIGINYNLEILDELHQKCPDKAFFSSENCATGTSRDWYYPDSREIGLLSAYDKDTNSWFRSRESTWKFFSEREWLMGGYQWAGFEHRGETTWPRLCSQSGAIDLFLQKKDAFYQNQSHWCEEPNIHILPHWNVESYNGEPIRVWAYTNCEMAELFLNGESLGKKTVVKNEHVEWLVEYVPGEIKAVGYIDGLICAEDCHETTGIPEKLMLRLENKVESANDVAIITCYTVDKEGRFVPTASPLVTFHATPFGRIIATGSDVCDHTPPSSPTRKMRGGYISVAVGVATERGCLVGESGSIEVYAHAEGLKSAKIKININMQGGKDA